MKELLVIVTTYNRPQSLARLLGQLNGQAEQLAAKRLKLRIVVFDDASSTPVDSHGAQVIRAERNHGKRNYWQWVNAMFHRVKALKRNTAYVIILPDDVKLCRMFYKEAIDTWESVKYKDPRTVAVSLLSDDRTTAPNWTGVPPVSMKIWVERKREHEPSRTVLKTQWVDMAFIADTTIFRALAWKLSPVNPQMWKHHPERGSGVGHQMSVRLHKLGYSMYHVCGSLLQHGDEPSVMNPKARSRHPLIATHAD